MRCPVCKSRNGDDAIFCQTCRTPLSLVKTPDAQFPHYPENPAWQIPQQQTEPVRHDPAQPQDAQVHQQSQYSNIHSADRKKEPVIQQAVQYTQAAEPAPSTQPPQCASAAQTFQAPHTDSHYAQTAGPSYTGQFFSPPPNIPYDRQNPAHQDIAFSPPPQQDGHDKKSAGAYAKMPTGNILYNEETIGRFLTCSSKILIIITRVMFILLAALSAGLLIAFLTSYYDYSSYYGNGGIIIGCLIGGIIIWAVFAFFTPLFYSALYALGVLVNDIKAIRDSVEKDNKS